MSDEQAADAFLKTCHFMTIAVVNNGGPWAVPVYVSRRHGYEFEWESNPETIHSRAIEVHPRVALSLYRLTDGEVKEFGFYAEANAEKVNDLPDGRATYRAIVTRAWINDEQHRKREIDV